MNAGKQRFGAGDLDEVLEGVQQVFVAKGKKSTELDLGKDAPSADELAKLLLGPTGNLRAPTVRSGKKLLVGFNEEIYGKVFGA